jgi:hypothetical protein
MKLALVACLILLFGTLTQVSPLVKAETNSISFSSGLIVYSPLNETYTSNNVQLNCTFNWQAATQVFINYSLDGNLIGQLPLSFGNITGFHQVYLAYGLVDLPNLSNGSHVLTFNVESKLNGYGNVASWVNEVYFSIYSSQLTPTPTPSVPEFSWLTILPLLLTIPIVLAIVRKRLQGNV